MIAAFTQGFHCSCHKPSSCAAIEILGRVQQQCFDLLGQFHQRPSKKTFLGAVYPILGRFSFRKSLKQRTISNSALERRCKFSQLLGISSSIHERTVHLALTNIGPIFSDILGQTILLILHIGPNRTVFPQCSFFVRYLNSVCKSEGSEKRKYGLCLLRKWRVSLSMKSAYEARVKTSLFANGCAK